MTTPSDEQGGQREGSEPPQGPPPDGPQSPGPESPPGPPPPPGQGGWQPPGPQAPPPPAGGWAQPPPQPGYAQPYGGSLPNAPGSVPALVLGILGLVICALCAPFAWNQGLSAERKIAQEPGRWGGKGMATAGKILGMIGTVLLAIGIVAAVVLIAVGASSS